jgi:hypothetical protein
MARLNRPEHFLYRQIEEIEVIGDAQKGKFEAYFTSLGIPWVKEQDPSRSQIDWSKIRPMWEFEFDYEGCEADMKAFLKGSILAQQERVITWVDGNEPILAIRVSDFIEHWYEFNVASGWMGLQFCTQDGKLFFEMGPMFYTMLRSNFEIKPGTKVE